MDEAGSKKVLAASKIIVTHAVINALFTKNTKSDSKHSTAIVNIKTSLKLFIPFDLCANVTQVGLIYDLAYYCQFSVWEVILSVLVGQINESTIKISKTHKTFLRCKKFIKTRFNVWFCQLLYFRAANVLFDDYSFIGLFPVIHRFMLTFISTFAIGRFLH